MMEQHRHQRYQRAVRYIMIRLRYDTIRYDTTPSLTIPTSGKVDMVRYLKAASCDASTRCNNTVITDTAINYTNEWYGKNDRVQYDSVRCGTYKIHRLMDRREATTPSSTTSSSTCGTLQNDTVRYDTLRTKYAV